MTDVIFGDKDWAMSADGRRVAREWARWHLGDPSWADQIIGAYLQPEEAEAILSAERDDPE